MENGIPQISPSQLYAGIGLMIVVFTIVVSLAVFFIKKLIERVNASIETVIGMKPVLDDHTKELESLKGSIANIADRFDDDMKGISSKFNSGYEKTLQELGLLNSKIQYIMGSLDVYGITDTKKSRALINDQVGS